MSYTRGKILRDSIAFHLSGIKLQLGQRFVPLRLSEEQRYNVADKVVAKLKERSGFWELDELMPERRTPPSPGAEEWKDRSVTEQELKVVVDLVSTYCGTDTDSRGEVFVDSGAIAVNASAMQLLIRYDLLEVATETSRRVRARWTAAGMKLKVAPRWI